MLKAAFPRDPPSEEMATDTEEAGAGRKVDACRNGEGHPAETLESQPSFKAAEGEAEAAMTLLTELPQAFVTSINQVRGELGRSSNDRSSPDALQNQLVTYQLRGKNHQPNPGAGRLGRKSSSSPKKERRPHHNHLSRELSQTLTTSTHSMFGRKEFVGLVQATPLAPLNASQASKTGPTSDKPTALQLADKPPLPQLAHARTTMARHPPHLKEGEANAAFQQVMKTREKKRWAACDASQPPGELKSVLKQPAFRPSPSTQKIVNLIN